jgi:antitoxin component of MazEF toxin-antitoxin module
MRLLLAKWGNGLALRLPAECVRATGPRQGDSVDTEAQRCALLMISLDTSAGCPPVRRQAIQRTCGWLVQRVRRSRLVSRTSQIRSN